MELTGFLFFSNCLFLSDGGSRQDMQELQYLPQGFKKLQFEKLPELVNICTQIIKTEQIIEQRETHNLWKNNKLLCCMDTFY